MQVFCVCVVTWELFRGTQKYLSRPVANVVYTVEADLPMITVCPQMGWLKYGPMPVAQNDLFWKGKFYPNDKEGNLKDCTESRLTDSTYNLNFTIS